MKASKEAARVYPPPLRVNKMTEIFGLENGADTNGLRSEQVARSEAECHIFKNENDVCLSRVIIPRVPRNGVVIPPIPKEKPKIKVTEFNCRKCSCIVWINNDTREAIRNEFNGEYYNKACGLCRSCFVNLRDREMIINRSHISE